MVPIDQNKPESYAKIDTRVYSYKGYITPRTPQRPPVGLCRARPRCGGVWGGGGVGEGGEGGYCVLCVEPPHPQLLIGAIALYYPGRGGVGGGIRGGVRGGVRGRVRRGVLGHHRPRTRLSPISYDPIIKSPPGSIIICNPPHPPSSHPPSPHPPSPHPPWVRAGRAKIRFRDPKIPVRGRPPGGVRGGRGHLYQPL